MATMRVLALLLLGCSLETAMADPFCRWQPVGSWTAPGDGAAWVEGEVGIVREGAAYCPSERCIDVKEGDVLVLLDDPLSGGGDFYSETGRHCE